MNPTHLLRTSDLAVHYVVDRDWRGRPRRILRAVDGVDLQVSRGSTLALVGESGCGKSTIARAVLRLVPVARGTIEIDGTDVLALRGESLRRFRRRMQIVFQDPVASLDPRLTVGQAVAEGMEVHRMARDRELREKTLALLDQVGLPADAADRRPHEFSGGQRQRVGIARALAVAPDLLVLDEPVSSLDVSIQAQVLNLLAELRDRRGLGYLFIAHDLGVVRHMADRVAVMYLGRIVEEGLVEQICGKPRHPYTRLLVAAVPARGRGRGRSGLPDRGELPSPLNPPPGCPFHPRCGLARASCRSEAPALTVIEDGRKLACPVAAESGA